MLADQLFNGRAIAALGASNESVLVSLAEHAGSLPLRALWVAAPLLLFDQ